MTDDVRYVLMTYGEYSDYGVGGLLVGPASPSIADLRKQFIETYASGYDAALDRYYEFYSPENYRIAQAMVERARRHLREEGCPVESAENRYGGYISDLFEAWLIWRCGFRQVPYVELHEGRVDV